MHAKELIRNNPFIESISYFDELSNKTVGFVNAFGGLGKDFLLVPGKEYEISAKKDIRLKIL